MSDSKVKSATTGHNAPYPAQMSVKAGAIVATTRRRFVTGLGALGVAGLLPMSRGFAQGASSQELTGPQFDLTLDAVPFNVTGRASVATAINGLVPGPVLRWREGDTVTLNVTNRLRESSSIHWHGILLPTAMDGVPGLSYRGIAPGETFTYRFPVKQSGTFWYHSHSGMQEQTGLYGALIIEPRDKEPYVYDREYIIQLSDWTDEDPATVVANLKQQSDYYNYHQRTLATFLADAREAGLSSALDDRLMWGDMRMSPTDIADVTGAIYTYLVNGRPPAANWTALFNPGEKVRLRFVNSSAMTTFDVRIPGLPLTVVAADGCDVEPVLVGEFRIGVAETYDVIVEPRDAAFTIFAQSQDRSGYARATLAPRAGMSAAIPPMDPPPLRTMSDMGMAHDMAGMGQGSMAASDEGQAMAAMPDMDNGAMDHSAMDHGAMDMGGVGQPAEGMSQMSAMPEAPVVNADNVDPATMGGSPNVDNVAMAPQSRLSEPGTGLENNGRRVLTYADLRALKPNASAMPPQRTIEFHLTGNMERFIWGFDGKKFSASSPVHLKLGERVRFVLINNTMMEHPIHLHGFFTALENGQGDHLPLKHTVNVKPNERVSYVFTADTPGYWAFHCHLLYHMETGMFRTVVVA